MVAVYVFRRAQYDFDEILNRLEDVAGARIASRYATSLTQAINRLEEFPGTGAPRPRLGKDMRVAIVTPYLVIYRHALGSDTVEILRILHGRRRITRRTLE